MESMGLDIPAKTCLALLIIPHAHRRASSHPRCESPARRAAHRRVGRRRARLDPEVVVVQLPSAHGSAADIGTRLRAKARFSPLILVGLYRVPP